MTAQEEKRRTELLDALARLEHEQWKSWALKLLDTEVLSEERANRWLSYCQQDWSVMTDEEKAKDREWAEQVLTLVAKHMGIK